MAYTSEETAADIILSTWTPVPGSDGRWEYDATPAPPDIANTGQYNLWLQQTAGIREVVGQTSNAIYVKCRTVGSPAVTMGELNKDFYDNL